MVHRWRRSDQELHRTEGRRHDDELETATWFRFQDVPNAFEAKVAIRGPLTDLVYDDVADTLGALMAKPVPEGFVGCVDQRSGVGSGEPLAPAGAVPA